MTPEGTLNETTGFASAAAPVLTKVMVPQYEGPSYVLVWMWMEQDESPSVSLPGSSPDPLPCVAHPARRGRVAMAASVSPRACSRPIRIMW